MANDEIAQAKRPTANTQRPKVTCNYLGNWELGIGSSHTMPVSRARRALRLLVPGRAPIEVHHGGQRVRGARREAVLELRVGAGRTATRPGARGRRRSAGSIPVSMGGHRGLLIGRKQKGHHLVADDGPLSNLNLSGGYIIRWP